METIQYKYPIGTKVFFLITYDNPTSVTCDLCNGEGKLLKLNHELITCPKCSGNKKIQNGMIREYFVKSSYVEEIDVHIDSFENRTEYWIREGSFLENQLFPTEEEALESKPKGASGYASSQGTCGTPL